MEQQEATILTIRLIELHPNDYNPNQMTEEEFAELVAELKRLGRLPKPIVVRPDGSRYVIIDGEQNWRAAQEVGLTKVPCEVIKADDFEAMRQTYKRNQHGTHNPVKLGQMFQRMMAARGLSQRALAEEMEVSEGTVRNALFYMQAAELRNSYAGKEEKKILFEKLSIRQIRCYVHLPRKIADLWLDHGADLEEIAGRDNNGCFYRYTVKRRGWRSYPEWGRFEHLENLVDFVRGRTEGKFREAIKILHKWHKCMDEWMQFGFKEEDILPYFSHHFRGVWQVREESMMDSCFAALVDQSTRPPRLFLTPEEFTNLLETGKSDSHTNFEDRLRLAIAKKTSHLPEPVWSGKVKDELRQLEIDTKAPEYIKASNVDVKIKYTLWKLDYPDWAKQELLKAGIDKYTPEETIKWQLKKIIRQAELRQKWAEMDNATLAYEIAKRFPIYNIKKDYEAISVLTNKLAILTKEELMILDEYTEWLHGWKDTAAMIRAITLGL